MKTKLSLFICLINTLVYSQGPSYAITNNFSYEETYNTINNASNKEDAIGSNGYNFEILSAGVNSKFSEFATGVFRNKLIVVSSKKLGSISKIDPNTNEAYKDLFCLNVDKNGQLSKPYLFSRVLNTKDNEGQLAFSADQKTVYYTRSIKDNSLEYKIYRAVLEEGSHGNWINEELLSINGYRTSIEHPFLSPEGDKLYFSSNMADSFGGFDLYVSTINPDGTLTEPENLGSTINTKEDEKFPSLSKNGRYLYFSSKGHNGIGGYDLFVSKILSTTYKTPRNLGNSINTKYDEVAYFLSAKNKGYVSSNRPNGQGGFDMYTAVKEEVKQTLMGNTLDIDTKAKVPNTLVILKDEEGNEISRQITNTNAMYKFNVTPFEDYIITTAKDGFEMASFKFTANKNYSTTYGKNLELTIEEPLIVKTENVSKIVVENIYFDSAKHTIKEASNISLNKIVEVLKRHPKMKLAIHAHTDNKGDATYNLTLSEKRAISASEYLIANGISKDRLVPRGFGENNPIIDCNTDCSEENLQTNRRVEFIILD